MTQNRIKDLITVPPVETVIRLQDATTADLKVMEGLLSSFVVTEEIENIFRELFRWIKRRKGVGAFLKGNFGSGKSHLLAVLSLLLETSQSWQYLRHPLLEEYSDLQGQKLLVVRIALHNYASGEKLESLVFGEIETVLAENAGAPVLLRSSTILIEDFNRYILPHHRADFFSFIHGDEKNWEENIRSDRRNAAGLVYRFITRNNIPLKAAFDRRQALQHLVSVLEEYNFDGVLIALDELSEFLKSKTSTAAFTEDLRFLQFMGETCKRHPIYIVAALQESIENTGYIEKDIIYRIKDRYPLRFSLTAGHVNQLISRRLIHRKKSAAKAIEQIYRGFRAAFPGIDLLPDQFEEIYPVHPATVSMLEGLTPIFSQHRGVIDFIYHQLSGDANRNWPGMLDLPANTLMTPDAIFDHFRERIQEIPDLNPYIETVYKTLKREIPTLFEDERDLRIALKVVKMLVLVELSPLEKRLTIRRLAPMLNEPVSELDASINYTYLKEAILDRLAQEASYISTCENERGEPVYFISLELTLHQIVRNRINELLQEPFDIQIFFPRLFPKLTATYLPFKLFTDTARRKYVFQWQNTQREGWVYYHPSLYLDTAEVGEIYHDLTTTERDFALIISAPTEEPLPEASPLQTATRQQTLLPESNRFGNMVFVWVPRHLREDEINFLRKFKAYTILKEKSDHFENPRDRQISQIAEEWLEGHQPELNTLIEDLYSEGSLGDKNGWKSFHFMPFYNDMKDFLRQLFANFLQELYPRHSEIMPGDTLQAFALDKLFLQVIRPGGISLQEARQHHLEHLIESSLIPLSIARKEADRYILSLSASENDLIREMLDMCLSEHPVRVYNLYWHFRKSPWGLTKKQFYLLMGALIVSGKVTAFQSGNVVTLHDISQLKDGAIDAVGQGKLVAEHIQQALLPLLRLEEFQGISSHFSVQTQEQIWQRMKSFRQEVEQLLSSWRTLQERYRSYPAYQVMEKDPTCDLTPLEQFTRFLRVSYPAREGLEKLAEEVQPDQLARLSDSVGRVKEIIRFLKTRFVEFNQIYAFIQHPYLKNAVTAAGGNLSRLLENLYREITSGGVLKESSVNQAIQDFYQFQQEYVEWYSASHREYYENKIFQAPQALLKNPLLQVLKRFQRLEAIQAEPDWIAVQEQINRLPRRCQRNPERQLMNNPVCECGFIPGQEPPAADADSILKMAQQGVQSIFRQCQNTFRWALEAYQENLKRIGKNGAAEQIAVFLSFPPEQIPARFQELPSLITDDLIDVINEAIRGKVLILQRSMKSLTAQLSGRQKTVRDIRTFFEQWLTEGDTVSDDTFVQILTEPESPEVDLQAYQGVRHVIREEGIRFLEAFWLLIWAEQHRQTEWTAWVNQQYRVKEPDMEFLKTVARERVTAGDRERMSSYFENSTLSNQLLKLTQFRKSSVEQLLRFIIQEKMLETLSRTATEVLLKKIAPTEPLPEAVNVRQEKLQNHPLLNRWMHLQLLAQLTKLFQLIDHGDAAVNLMTFYLREGWRLMMLIDQLQQLNQGLELVPAQRLHVLQERVNHLREKLAFSTEKFSKKDLPLPYFSIHHFPKRLAELIAEDNYPVLLLIVDAMRWDIQERLQPLFRKLLPHHSLAFFGALEVASPTTTEMNRPLLVEKITEITRVLNWHLSTVSEDPREKERLRELIARNDGLVILNTTIVDSLLHERREPLGATTEVILTRMETLMGPLLKSITRDVTVVITSDHGFVEDNDGYQHGGDTFWEKVIPFSVWR
ncbi:MAG: hypothetical protein JRG88_12630 [Deltaproteobacteria bacterium]|nr:hypothetical protein [Deltaproteobacteria bacterium]